MVLIKHQLREELRGLDGAEIARRRQAGRQEPTVAPAGRLADHLNLDAVAVFFNFSQFWRDFRIEDGIIVF